MQRRVRWLPGDLHPDDPLMAKTEQRPITSVRPILVEQGQAPSGANQTAVANR